MYTVGDIVELTVRGIGSGGEGVAVGQESMPVFVRGVVTDETIQARITQSKPRFAWGELVQVVQASPNRVQPPCAYCGECGGCDLMHMGYADQIKAKESIVASALQRIGGVQEGSYDFFGVLPAEPALNYRNKAVYHVRGGQIGFFLEGSHKLIPVRDCALQSEASQKIAASVAEWLKMGNGRGLDAVMTRTLRNGASQCVLLSAEKKIAKIGLLIDKLMQNVPGLASVVHCQPTRGENPGATVAVLYGQETLMETLHGLPYEVSPQTFLQVHPQQADALLDAAIEFAQPQGKRLLDAYCGAGALALAMASAGAAKVHGVEIVPEAIEDARRNAQRADLSAKCRFDVGAVEDILPSLLKNEKFDIAVLDPPRKGCQPRALEALAKANIPQLVYVSCDPATLARDVRILSAKGYILQKVQSVDMFPQTAHCETVAFLTR